MSDSCFTILNRSKSFFLVFSYFLKHFFGYMIWALQSFLLQFLSICAFPPKNWLPMRCPNDYLMMPDTHTLVRESLMTRLDSLHFPCSLTLSLTAERARETRRVSDLSLPTAAAQIGLFITRPLRGAGTPHLPHSLASLCFSTVSPALLSLACHAHNMMYFGLCTWHRGERVCENERAPEKRGRSTQETARCVRRSLDSARSLARIIPLLL